MLYVEIQAGEGGDDAANFADTLTQAVIRWAGNTDASVEVDGDVLVISGHYL
jgi:protein subunit release factor B